MSKELGTLEKSKQLVLDQVLAILAGGDLKQLTLAFNDLRQLVSRGSDSIKVAKQLCERPEVLSKLTAMACGRLGREFINSAYKALMLLFSMPHSKADQSVTPSFELDKLTYLKALHDGRDLPVLLENRGKFPEVSLMIKTLLSDPSCRKLMPIPAILKQLARNILCCKDPQSVSKIMSLFEDIFRFERETCIQSIGCWFIAPLYFITIITAMANIRPKAPFYEPMIRMLAELVKYPDVLSRMQKILEMKSESGLLKKAAFVRALNAMSKRYLLSRDNINTIVSAVSSGASSTKAVRTSLVAPKRKIKLTLLEGSPSLAPQDEKKIKLDPAVT